jgi:Predicted metal-dependent hydrolase with the TIM-barrel fold
MILKFKYSFLITSALFIFCGTLNVQSKINEKELINYAYESTYIPAESNKTIIINANILTGRGDSVLGGAILMDNNKIVAIGEDIDTSDANVIDAQGK